MLVNLNTTSLSLLRSKAVRRVRRARRRAQLQSTVDKLEQRNLESSAPLLGTAPAVVSLTSYAARIHLVHLSIESIGAGRVRPQRIILWLDDKSLLTSLPQSLRNLQQRGLEIRQCENLGPHKKYYPYVAASPHSALPLVTADDDIIYPGRWLKRLCSAHFRHPEAIHAYMVRTAVLQGTRMADYSQWPYATGRKADPAAFVVGVSGVLYPPGFVAALAAAGDGFRQLCPWADDVWLSWVAFRTRRDIRQVHGLPEHFPMTPGSQEGSLMQQNVLNGRNDRYLEATFSQADRLQLRRMAGSS